MIKLFSLLISMLIVFGAASFKLPILCTKTIQGVRAKGVKKELSDVIRKYSFYFFLDKYANM